VPDRWNEGEGHGWVWAKRVSNAWRDPAFEGPPVKSALVLAMKRDPTLRRIWEDALSGELARHGVTATPAYRVFPDVVPDTTAIATAVKDEAIECVAKKLASEESTRRSSPGWGSVR